MYVPDVYRNNRHNRLNFRTRLRLTDWLKVRKFKLLHFDLDYSVFPTCFTGLSCSLKPLCWHQSSSGPVHVWDMFLKLTNCGHSLQVIQTVHPLVWGRFPRWTGPIAFTVFQGVSLTVGSSLCFGRRHVLLSGLADYLGLEISSGTQTELVSDISGRGLVVDEQVGHPWQKAWELNKSK